MAHVHVLSDDLLFGSRLQADLTAAGHEVTLGPQPQRDAQAIVADLTHDADGRLETLATVLASTPPRPAILAFFAHVEPGVRERALAAGVDQAVPRSRIAREGPALLAALLATAR
jgi:DNA-binding NarL/FixJ family response regulator